MIHMFFVGSENFSASGSTVPERAGLPTAAVSKNLRRQVTLDFQITGRHFGTAIWLALGGWKKMVKFKKKWLKNVGETVGGLFF